MGKEKRSTHTMQKGINFYQLHAFFASLTVLNFGGKEDIVANSEEDISSDTH